MDQADGPRPADENIKKGHPLPVWLYPFCIGYRLAPLRMHWFDAAVNIDATGVDTCNSKRDQPSCASRILLKKSACSDLRARP